MFVFGIVFIISWWTFLFVHNILHHKYSSSLTFTDPTKIILWLLDEDERERELMKEIKRERNRKSRYGKKKMRSFTTRVDPKDSHLSFPSLTQLLSLSLSLAFSSPSQQVVSMTASRKPCSSFSFSISQYSFFQFSLSLILQILFFFSPKWDGIFKCGKKESEWRMSWCVWLERREKQNVP